MKYKDLKKEAQRIEGFFQKYSKKANWKKIFSKNKQKVTALLEKIDSTKQETTHFYHTKKEQAQEIWNTSKKNIEKNLPPKEEIIKKRNRLLYTAIVELEKIPMKWSHHLGQYLGKFAYRFNRRRRTFAIKQLKIAFPHWSNEKIVKVAQDSFENLGESIFETIKKANYGKDIQKHIKIVNLKPIEQLKKTGGILVTGHFANWEFITFVLEKTGLQGIFLGKEESSFAQDIIGKYRKIIGWKTVSVGSKSLAFDVLQTIKEKKIIYTMLDTDPVKAKTTSCVFFGKKTKVPIFTAKMAKKFNLPVVAVFNHRTKTKKHIFTFETLSQPSYKEKGEQELTQIYTTAIENHIRKHPTQWRWVMPRWKNEIVD